MKQKRHLSTFDVAELLGVDPGSVANWIDGGRLKAYRTPGGHRRVQTTDLVVFLREHDMPVPEGLDHQQIRVVVVDDEPAMAQMIARAIKTAHPDYELTEAHDGFQAGTVIATVRPDVVILDLRMPGMDGFEVCRMIKSQDTTRHATVIAVTAFPSPEARRQIVECGAADCLEKPLELEMLISAVEEALQ